VATVADASSMPVGLAALLGDAAHLHQVALQPVEVLATVKLRILVALAALGSFATASCASKVPTQAQQSRRPDRVTPQVSAAAGPHSAGGGTAPLRSHAGIVRFHESGGGIKQSRKFTASADWDIAYTYDCSSSRGASTFFIVVYDAQNRPFINPGVSMVGVRGANTTHEHNAGTFYLAIGTTCRWAVQVVNAK